MKYRVVLCLVTVFFIFAVTAVTSFAAPVIKADKTYYDVNTGLYMLNGNVYVEVKDRIVTAGQAKVSLSTLEVWGTGGITLTEGDIYLTADSVYVAGFQNKSIIDGNVTFKRNGLVITADKGEFNWKTKLGNFSGNVKVVQGDNAWSGSAVTYNVETNDLQYGN
jgi:lipopolysaccharide export system protein LptA